MEARYQRPATEKLTASLKSIPGEYTKNIKNKDKPERECQIQLLTDTVPQISLELENTAISKTKRNELDDAQLGVAFFLHAYVKWTYQSTKVVSTVVSYTVPSCVSSLFSAAKSCSPVSLPYNPYDANNSHFFRLLDKALLLDEKSNKGKATINSVDNPDDPTLFICHAALLKYLKNHPELAQQKMLEEIQASTRRARRPLANKIKELFKKLADKKLIRDGFAPLIACYKAIRGPESRKEDIEWLETVDKMLEESHASDEDKLSMRKGAAVVIMAKIENSIGIKTPLLYTLLQEFTSLKSSSEFPKLSLASLATLNSKVINATTFEDETQFWKKHGIKIAVLDNAIKEIRALQTELAQQDEKVHISSSPLFNNIVNKLFNCASSTLTQTGVLMAMLQIVQLTASQITIDTLIGAVATVSPPNAFFMLGAAYGAQYLRGSISSTITSTIKPITHYALTLPVNTLFGQTPPPLPATKTPSLTEEESRLIRAMHETSYLFPDEKLKITELAKTFALDKPEDDLQPGLSPRKSMG